MSTHQAHAPLEPGRAATAISGRFGDELPGRASLFSRGRGMNNPDVPLFVLLHGWGSNGDDIAEFFGESAQLSGARKRGFVPR